MGDRPRLVTINEITWELVRNFLMGGMPIKQLSSSCKRPEWAGGSWQQQSDPFSCQRGGPISKYIKWCWNEQKYAHGSWQGLKVRMTVLAKASSKLLLCSLCKRPVQFSSVQFSAMQSRQEISEFSAEKVSESVFGWLLQSVSDPVS
jgi:hypothetical protein